MGLDFKKKEADKMSTEGTSTEITEEVKEVTEEKEKTAFELSAEELEVARDGRDFSDIPLTDNYWNLRNAHTLAHHEHKPRVDDLKTEVKIKELEAKGIKVEELSK